MIIKQELQFDALGIKILQSYVYENTPTSLDFHEIQ